MNTPRAFSLLLCCLFACTTPTRAADPSVDLPPIPAGLAVPANQERALVLTAKGVQIYECHALAGEPGKFEWVFKAPEADLFDASGKKVGRHYAGPTWELTDDGKLIGKLKTKMDAPDGKGVAWLLLDVASRDGGGVMAKVQSIQRLATVGGKTPVEVADQTKVGQERRVDYSATYVFYVAKP